MIFLLLAFVPYAQVRSAAFGPSSIQSIARLPHKLAQLGGLQLNGFKIRIVRRWPRQTTLRKKSRKKEGQLESCPGVHIEICH